jgi:ABC-type transport system substrate-binding protein
MGRSASGISGRLSASILSALAIVAAVAAVAAPVALADDAKVLRLALSDITSLDPQQITDLYSRRVADAIFEGLYQFDPIASPAKVVPNTATAMPEISADGRTWTIRIQPGILFGDDPAFNGKPRELVAADYVYSITRALDPTLKSGGDPAFTDLIVGARAVIDAAKKTGKVDYDAKIEGLQATDRYTLQLKLNAVDYTVLERLAYLTTYAVAREVVDAAGRDIQSRPVGTGPFVLKEWRRASRIVLEANPNYRTIAFPQTGGPELQSLMKSMQGRKLPALSRIEVSIIEEQVPELLAFEQGSLDYVSFGGTIVSRLLDDSGKLRREHAARGVRHIRFTVPALIYTYFNQDDPIVGGNAPEKIALRRAIAMGFDNAGFIRGLYGGHAVPATQLLPIGVDGHDTKVPLKALYDPAAARALLDRYGYRDRDGDGWRELPDGRPLTLVQSSDTTSLDREANTLWLASMKAIGLRMIVNTQPFSDLLKAASAGQLMMFNLGNRSTSPSGYNILQQLWGKAPQDQNFSRFRNADYDAAFEKFLRTPAGPDRIALARRMSDIVNTYVPIMIQVYPVGHAFTQPWLLGYHPSAFGFGWKLIDIDVAKKRGAAK